MSGAMLLNALISLAMFVLLAFAWGRRPGVLVEALAIALAVTLGLTAIVEKPDQLAMTLAVDASIVAFMAHLAKVSRPDIAETARIIMAISTFKIVFVIGGVLLELNHNTRAAARNGAFVVQIIVAGGMADGLIAWLGHRGRLIGDRARRVLHRLEGE